MTEEQQKNIPEEKTETPIKTEEKPVRSPFGGRPKGSKNKPKTGFQPKNNTLMIDNEKEEKIGILSVSAEEEGSISSNSNFKIPEGYIPARSFKCDICGFGFNNSTQLNAHRYHQHKIVRPEDKSPEEKAGFQINVPMRGLRLSADRLALAQLLIKNNKYKNLNEILDAGVFGLVYGFDKLGGENMEKSTIEQMQDVEMKDAWINKIKNQTESADVKTEIDVDKAMSKMFEQARIKQAYEMLSGGGNMDMNKIMTMMMMKQLFGEGDKKHDSAMRVEVEALKSQLQQQQLINQFTAQINELKNNKGNSSNDLIIALERIRTDAEKKNEGMKDQLMQREREFFSEKINDLKDSLSNSGSGFEKQIVDKIQSKILEKVDAGSLMGENKDEHSAARELITGVIDKIKGPLLEPIGRGLQERIARGGSFPGVPQQQPPQYAEPVQMTPEQMSQYSPDVIQQMQEQGVIAPQPVEHMPRRNIEVVRGGA